MIEDVRTNGRDGFHLRFDRPAGDFVKVVITGAADEIEGLYQLFMRGDSHPMNIGNPDEYTVKERADSPRTHRVAVGDPIPPVACR